MCDEVASRRPTPGLRGIPRWHRWRPSERAPPDGSSALAGAGSSQYAAQEQAANNRPRDNPLEPQWYALRAAITTIPRCSLGVDSLHPRLPWADIIPQGPPRSPYTRVRRQAVSSSAGRRALRRKRHSVLHARDRWNVRLAPAPQVSLASPLARGARLWYIQAPPGLGCPAVDPGVVRA